MKSTVSIQEEEQEIKWIRKMKAPPKANTVKPVTIEDRTIHCKWQGGTRSE
ncbi:hypothetical protein EFK13_07720 [Bacillus cabrialesii]|uniref:hypothetical protein n=1 Tax=Bacillus cabrialesii TaxID=2487276 RepID=UPI00200D6F83|nr:hypothetical protein [Bacillus cabrialesii]UQE80445.1 hypothetical protein EFK13_07720 [Bacillus cabrialesii]